MASKRKQRAEPDSYSLLDRVGHTLEDPSSALVPMAKAAFVGEESGTQSNAIVEQNNTTAMFTNSGAVAPIYEPTILGLIFENSSSLRQNVDAYITNIDSYGHHFLPVLDLTADDVDEKIRDALRAERRYAKKNNTDPAKAIELLGAVDEPTDEEVAVRKTELAIEMRAEMSDLEAFFANCTPTLPFAGPEGLRGLTRQDIEVFGNGYWEVLRNGLGEITQFNRLESRSIRLMPVDKEATSAPTLYRVSNIKTIKRNTNKRFRNCVQRYEGSSTYVFYKEFGDPRVCSAATGRRYTSLDLMKASEPEAAQATEIMSFKISSVRSVYGAPRWVGAMLAVLGTRQSEEVNFLYFENRSVPPMVLIVSGGKIAKENIKRLEDHIANNVRGKRNFHKMMIIEAENMSADGSNNGKMKIELKPLTGAQQQDALFQAYDERNADKVGQTFRLPRLLRGDVRDFNRSCYSEDTETLTENGWKLWHEISATEKIAAFNKDTGEIVFVVPEKKLVYDVVDEELIHFHNQQTDCLVTTDHRMLVKPVKGEAWEVFKAGDIPYGRFKVPVTSVKYSDKTAAWETSPVEDTELKWENVDTVIYTGKVYCFSVPEYGFFVTRRDNKVAIQGNTAEASVDFAEIQVFGPIRQQFDWMMNTQVLPELGIQYHYFKSNAPTIRDPEALATMIATLAGASILVPEEGRKLARGVFNEELPNIKEPWTKTPLAITLAQMNASAKGVGGGPLDDFNQAGGMSSGNAAGTQAALGVDQSKADTSTGDLASGGALVPAQGTQKPKKLDAVASALLKIRKMFLEQERADFAEERANAETITIPNDLFEACFTPDGE